MTDIPLERLFLGGIINGPPIMDLQEAYFFNPRKKLEFDLAETITDEELLAFWNLRNPNVIPAYVDALFLNTHPYRQTNRDLIYIIALVESSLGPPRTINYANEIVIDYNVRTRRGTWCRMNADFPLSGLIGRNVK